MCPELVEGLRAHPGAGRTRDNERRVINKQPVRGGPMEAAAAN
jgi:hypothetical protein